MKEKRVSINCGCGCGRVVEVPERFLDSGGRVKKEFIPQGYYEEGDGYIISAVGYVYAHLKCLNRMNEE